MADSGDQYLHNTAVFPDLTPGCREGGSGLQPSLHGSDRTCHLDVDAGKYRTQRLIGRNGSNAPREALHIACMT